jgi:O-antigen/teichoic acid export membrane protein
MTTGQRVILNTCATYVRSLLALALGLVSGRWILAGLGAADYGYFSVVGGLLFIITVVGDSFGAVSGRQFAYALGEGDTERVRNWFTVAFQFHLIAPALLLGVGWLPGEWCVRNLLVIAPERLASCLWVFRLSLVSSYFTMLSVPFIAMYHAKQYIALLSVISLIRSFGMLVLGFILLHLGGDRLLCYAGGVTMLTVALALIQICVARAQFPECRPSFRPVATTYYRVLLGLSCFQLFGNIGYAIREQGLSVLVNRHFEAAINASISISKTLVTQSAAMANALQSALAPAITQEIGAQNTQRAIRMSNMLARNTTILNALFAVPLFFEIDKVLDIWLVQTPPCTGVIFRWILFHLIIERTTSGTFAVLYATGKIKPYMMISFFTLVIALPMMLGLIRLGLGVYAFIAAYVFSSVLTTYTRLFCACRQHLTSHKEWWMTVFRPCLLAILFGGVCAWAVCACLPETVWRMPLTAISAWFGIGTSFFIVSDLRDDRRLVFSKLFELKFRFKALMRGATMDRH